MLISYTILKVTLTFDIKGHVIHISVDIGYNIALRLFTVEQKLPLLTLTLKSLSATCPVFLHPLFAQF
jgi:hypothetical protein